MTPAAIALIVVFLGVGGFFGWHWHTTYAAHGDIKVAKTRMRNGRRTRLRSGLWVLAIAILLVLIAKDALHL